MYMLITDLDNTIYDWVTFYSKALQTIVQQLANSLNIHEEQIYKEFQVINKRFRSIEHPHSFLEIESVKKAFDQLIYSEVKNNFFNPFVALDAAMDAFLTAYESVEETLIKLKNSGCKIVGHTDAIPANAYLRLKKLNLDFYLDRIYTPGDFLNGQKLFQEFKLNPCKDFLRTTKGDTRKPNPTIVEDICQREGIETCRTYYLGDSLQRDISMAKLAGTKSIWARYGSNYSKSHWDVLVKVTHWSEKEVELESKFEVLEQKILPDYTINSFSEVLDVVGK